MYILKALLSGRAVDLQRLAGGPKGMEKERWAELEDVAVKLGLNVTDPGCKVLKKDILSCILGAEKMELSYNQITPEQAEIRNMWYKDIEWWTTLKRVGFVPQFQ
ncbi:hypothetical protein AAMO2058_000124300 [Amorphochlora amoebiformis]|mmetsp:Transcript_31915/g.51326  ORF Transcript_31915/g.51326 Transcript_31915/m.51326 type:complete len:105 (+) Transcript_31915:228-542(+)